uniref:Phosphoglycerate mutase family protein n=1 Tax=Panagrolaimus sp. ES5 TaxID=591445 RepID=A0AC34FVY6_9BILA
MAFVEKVRQRQQNHFFRRPESRYKLDPPLTEHGKVTASMTAMGILRNKLPFKIIYCAPEMASVQTANTVSLASKKKQIPIRIEPALANWRGFIKFYDGPQYWESKEYYSKLGYNIDLEYQEFLKESEILQEESARDFLQRKLDFFSKIVDENLYECVLIIGHAATVCMAADGNWDSKTQLLDIERSGMPCSVHGIHLGPDGEHSHLSRPTLPFTPTLFDAQERAKKSMVSEREKPKKRYVKSFGLSNDSGSSEEDSSDQNTSQ